MTNGEENELKRRRQEKEELRGYVRTYARERRQVRKERLLKLGAGARERREDSEPVARSDVSELRLQAGR